MKKEVAVGIDIGGTNTEFGLVDRIGHCLAHDCMKTNQYDDVIPFMDELTDKIKSQINCLGEAIEVKGIGVGAPNGNYFNGTIEFAPNLKWKGVVRVSYLLEERMKLPVVLTNDANAAAIGEMLYGAAKGMKDFIVITLGTGLGSGIVVNGELLYGHDGFAGELGHTIVDPLGRKCGCGRSGCLETYASATGIVRTVKEMLLKNNRPSLLRTTKLSELNSRSVFFAAELDDQLALDAFEYTGKILGMKLADAIAFSSPEAIILFGGLAKAGDFIFLPTRKYMEQYLLSIYRDKVKLLPSLLKKENAAVLGAAALVWTQKKLLQT